LSEGLDEDGGLWDDWTRGGLDSNQQAVECHDPTSGEEVTLQQAKDAKIDWSDAYETLATPLLGLGNKLGTRGSGQSYIGEFDRSVSQRRSRS
jgi:hypothetical protein